jgi:hypothetical protein
MAGWNAGIPGYQVPAFLALYEVTPVEVHDTTPSLLQGCVLVVTSPGVAHTVAFVVREQSVPGAPVIGELHSSPPPFNSKLCDPPNPKLSETVGTLGLGATTLSVVSADVRHDPIMLPVHVQDDVVDMPPNDQNPNAASAGVTLIATEAKATNK